MFSSDYELLVRIRLEREGATRTGTGAARRAVGTGGDVDRAAICQPAGSSTRGRCDGGRSWNQVDVGGAGCLLGSREGEIAGSCAARCVPNAHQPMR